MNVYSSRSHTATHEKCARALEMPAHLIRPHAQCVGWRGALARSPTGIMHCVCVYVQSVRICCGDAVALLLPTTLSRHRHERRPRVDQDAPNTTTTTIITMITTKAEAVALHTVQAAPATRELTRGNTSFVRSCWGLWRSLATAVLPVVYSAWLRSVWIQLHFAFCSVQSAACR